MQVAAHLMDCSIIPSSLYIREGRGTFMAWHKKNEVLISGKCADLDWLNVFLASRRNKRHFSSSHNEKGLKSQKRP